MFLCLRSFFFAFPPLFCANPLDKMPRGVHNGASLFEKSLFNTTNCHLYHYAGNNPVRYVDPDGKVVIVDGDSDYRIQVEKYLQEICPSAKIDRESGILTTGSFFLRLFKNVGHRNGARLLKTLANDKKHTVTISFNENVLVKGAFVRPESGINSRNPKIGSDTYIGYDPSRPQKAVPELIDDSISLKSCPPSIALGHELIHALHNAKGTNAGDACVSFYMDLRGKPVNYSDTPITVKTEELRTVGIPGFTKFGDVTENKLRTEQGLNLRPRYY